MTSIKQECNFVNFSSILSGDNSAIECEINTSFLVRLVPDLSAAALRQHKTKELGLYYALKALDQSGRGSFTIDEAIEKLKTVFKYSESTFYTHLARGDGLFWVRYPGIDGRAARISLKSRLSVMLAMGIDQLTNSHFVEVCPIVFDSPDKRKAQIYASIHAPRGVGLHPKSRAYISQFTGLSKTKQRRLEIKACVARQATFETVYDEKLDKLVTSTLEVFSQNKSDPSKSKRYTIAKRLPNCYISGQLPGPHGCLKKVSKLLRSLKRDEAGEQVQKLYFDTYKGCRKVLQHRRVGTEALARVSPGRSVIKGRVEYERLKTKPGLLVPSVIAGAWPY
jgi:hypothetical protein